MNFFYSINVHDRVRFPILGDMRHDPLPDDTSLDVDLQDLKPPTNTKLDEEGYFGAFKQANCEKGLYCDEILKFLDGFFQRARGGARPWRSLKAFLDSFSSYVHTNANESRELMDTMNTKRLITPYIELDLPVNIIEEFNQLEEDDPRVNLYQLNPVWGTAIKEFGFFWERYESTKEVLCMFVWSTIDHAIVPLPAVGLNPYPLCWFCDKGFGTLPCTKCRVAKYCSKECLQQDCMRHGGPVCDLMATALRRVKQLTFKRPNQPTSISASSTPRSASPHTSSSSSSSTPPSISPSSSPRDSSPSPPPSPPALRSRTRTPSRHPPTTYTYSSPDLEADPPFAYMEHI